MKVTTSTTFLGAMLLAVMAVSVGCGKKNESGRSSNPYFNQFGTYPVGSVPVPGNLGTLANGAVSALFQSPCASGQQRIGLQVPVNMSVALNANYLGITSEGDIAVVNSNGSYGIMSIYLCYRPEFGNGTMATQPQLTRYPVINRSLYCQVDEITAASVYVPTYTGYPITLNFRPIQYGGPGTMNQIISQICRTY